MSLKAFPTGLATMKVDRNVVLLGDNGTSPVNVSLADLIAAVTGSAPLLVTASNTTVTVAPFSVGVWSCPGGAIAIPGSGEWYVGVEIWSKAVRLLPRLGHRGWIPVGRLLCDGNVVTRTEQIAPVMPECRIPRSVEKLMAGETLNVVVMGSSLTQGGGTTDWPGMLFNTGSSLEAYRVPGVVSVVYKGVGGAPNKYQLAQLGYASRHTAYGYPDSGYCQAVTDKTPPNGRSQLFSQADLVVIGCLANGGDHRLSVIEPLVRKLREAGTEVILVTDNPQIGTPWVQTQAAFVASGLYVDGPEVRRIADLYGVELADTAAYVVESALRYPVNGRIYGLNDTIHMAAGTPAGPTGEPSCGHEVWARAVRSIFPLLPPAAVVETRTFDFASGVQGWTAYASATVSAPSGALVTTKSVAFSDQWGGWITTLPAMNPGDRIRVRGTVTGAPSNSVQVGLQGGGWASDVAGLSADGPFDVTITCTQPSTSLLFFGGNNAVAQGSSFSVDNLIIDIAHTSVPPVAAAPGQPVRSQPVPPIRIVTDYQVPGDAFVILPGDELMVSGGDVRRGSLGAHPWGANSFARTWHAGTEATADLLTIPAGKGAYMSGDNVVSLALIRYQDENDAGCIVEVYRNDGLAKTITLGTVPFGNEWYTAIWEPDQYGQSAPTGGGDSIRILVVSGTLKVAAFVALTADQTYLSPEDLTYVGTWTAKETDGSQLPGYSTDVPGAYAVARCTGRRLSWVISGRSNSQPIDLLSDREIVLSVDTSGANHVRAKGGLLGPGANHIVRLVSAAASPDASNRSLHVGGAIIVNDR